MEKAATKYKVKSIHFPKSVEQLVQEEALEMLQASTPLRISPQLSSSPKIPSSSKTYFPKVPFKVKAVVDGKPMAIEGSFKLRKLTNDSMSMETLILFPDGSTVNTIDKLKKDGEEFKQESSLPPIENSSTASELWMNILAGEVKMACMKFLLQANPKI